MAADGWTAGLEARRTPGNPSSSRPEVRRRNGARVVACSVQNASSPARPAPSATHVARRRRACSSWPSPPCSRPAHRPRRRPAPRSPRPPRARSSLPPRPSRRSRRRRRHPLPRPRPQQPGRSSPSPPRPRSARRLSPCPAAPTRWTRRPGSGSRATGAVPLASLLERLRVEPALAYRVKAATDGRSAVLRPAAPLEPGASYRFTLVDPAGAPAHGLGVPGRRSAPGRRHAPPERDHRRPDRHRDRDHVRPGRRGGGAGRHRRCGSFRREPPVAGAIEMHGRAAVFVPGKRLLEGRVYEVRVRAGTGRARGPAGWPATSTFAFQAERDGAGRQGAGGARPGVRHRAPGRARAARGAPVEDAAGRWRGRGHDAGRPARLPPPRRGRGDPGAGAAARRPGLGGGQRPAHRADGRPLPRLLGTRRVRARRLGPAPPAPDRAAGRLVPRGAPPGVDQPGRPPGDRRSRPWPACARTSSWPGSTTRARGDPCRAPGSTSSAGRASAARMRAACWWPRRPAGLARAGSPVLVRMTADAGRRVIVDLAAGERAGHG